MNPINQLLQDRVMSSDSEEMQTLIESEADLNSIDEDGNTLLRHACHHSCVNIVVLLIDAGPKTSLVTRHGTSGPSMVKLKSQRCSCALAPMQIPKTDGTAQ